MTRECNENDERRITISGSAKQVDLNLKPSNAIFFGKMQQRSQNGIMFKGAICAADD